MDENAAQLSGIFVSGYVIKIIALPIDMLSAPMDGVLR